MGQSKKDDLAYKVLKDIKASPDLGLLRCVQCGMCASSCPAARHSEYDPRVVIKRVLDDDKTLLEDKYIWNCFYCYNCHSVQQQLEDVRKTLNLESMFLLPEAEKEVDKTLEAIGFKNRVKKIKDVRDKK